MDTLIKLDNIINKVTKLTVEKNDLLENKHALEAEINRLKQLLAEQTAEKEKLNNQIKIIKLAQNIGSQQPDDSGQTELKRKINEYIKEIDHCMAMLNE